MIHPVSPSVSTSVSLSVSLGQARPVAMRRRFTLLLALCLLVVAGGCSLFNSSKSSKKKVPEPKATKLTKFDAEVEVKRLWRASVGSGLGRKYVRLQPAVVADRVYAADGFGLVVAHDRFNGERVWKTRIGDADGPGLKFWDRRDAAFVSGGVGAGGGHVYVGTTRGVVVALSAADGSEVWRIDVGTEVIAPPVYDEGRVFVQTIDGRLIARESDTGEEIWTFDNPVPILTLRGTATPVASDGLVYSGFANGMVVAIKADDGQRLWQHRVMLPQGRSELDRMVDVDASPLLEGPIMYAVSFQGRLAAIRRADGRPLWERDASSFLNMAVGLGQLYFIDEEDKILAIDQESAEDSWQQEGFLRRELGSPVAYSNYVVVGDDAGYLHVLAQSDGRIIGRKKVDGDGLRSPFIEVDQTLYVVSNGGTLSAYDIRALD